eukprot:2705566-Amphidinium_carterae.1
MPALEAGDLTLAHTMEIRKAAREAFHFVDSSVRVRGGILSGPRPIRHYQARDQVYFWRREGDAQAFRRKHAGPALVIG